MATTAERLRQIMQARGLRQVDILRMVEPYCVEFGLKMSKSDISQFLSGKVQPGQWKLSLLGKALHVNPAWLMGESVEMEEPLLVAVTFPSEPLKLSPEEEILVVAYRNAPVMIQEAVMKILSDYQRKAADSE